MISLRDLLGESFVPEKPPLGAPDTLAPLASDGSDSPAGKDREGAERGKKRVQGGRGGQEGARQG